MVKERDAQFLRDHGCTTWGDFSTPPLPYAECDISRFWRVFDEQGFRDTEFRMLIVDGKIKDARILVYHNIILMLIVDYDTTNRAYPRCYIVGCDHAWRMESDGSGHCTPVCTKCGYRDSA